MLDRIVEFVFSKAAEKLIDYSVGNLRGQNNFKFTLETLERNLKSLSAKASDVQEEIKNGELSGKKKRKREVDNWLNEVNKIESEILTLGNEVEVEGFINRFFGGDRAEKLNARVCELVEQSRHFVELLLDVYGTGGKELRTRRLVGEAFEKNLERIWEFLISERVSTIGIYGMGGVGKTTLTKHIHNKLLKDTPYCVCWITVSQEFSIRMLQDEIARVVGLNLSDEYDVDKRAARLFQALSLKENFVLILDDVWNNISLDKVGDPLCVEGCRLIVTSRSLEVCRQIGCGEIIKVKTLYRDEAWSLFRETLGQKMTLAPQIQEIARSMAKVCDGLPLGIITVAGSMKGETDIHVWKNALAELKESIMGQDDTEDEVFKVLKCSFDWLDRSHQREGKRNGYTKLQRCFLYCSLYPEDFQIQREELISKFISEEFVDKRKSWKEQIDEGQAILNKLVNVCLLESTRDHLQHDCMKMHDLVRDMALKITEGKSMVIAGHYSLEEIPEEEKWTKDVEKMSLMNNQIMEIPDGISPNCPRLSTLLLHCNPLEFIPNSFFSQMHGLCILDLSRTNIKGLPNSLSDLENLKALLLQYCEELVCVPYLGKLKALRELDLSATGIKEVPQGMEKLFNLKFLSMKEAHYLEMFPTGMLLNFRYLQCLYLPFRIQAPVGEIEGLKQLELFQGRVKDVCDFNRFVRARQSRVHNTSYTIMVGPTYSRCDSNYNHVILNRYDLKKVEEKDVILLAQDIQHLKFDKCEGLSNCLLDDFPRLNNPKFLETLTVYDCEGIECILSLTTTEQFLMAQEELESRSLSLRTLEVLRLRWLPDFMGVIREVEIGAEMAPPPPPQAVFSSLRRLYISQCNKMKKLGLRVSEIPNLEEIKVNDCEEIEEIIEVADDDGRVVSLLKLERLSLESLPRLKSICNATMVCSSIQTIHFWRCTTLRKLPLFFPASTTVDGQPHYSPPPALKEIKLYEREREWWESLEWEHPTHNHLLQPFLHVL